MEKNPLVSVIVPNYNYARYLDARIDSILRQTWTDFELILLDDASTDTSREILEKYRDHPRVSRIEFNTRNTGSPFQQWMKGILLARGKYIWIAEADDLADPDFLETTVTLCEAHERTAVCVVGSWLIDGAGRVSNKDINHWGRRKGKQPGCFDGKSYALHNLYWKNYLINASGILFRREYAVRLAHSAFLQMRYCGDWLFWFQMALQGEVIEVYRTLNYFRQHGAKVTVQSLQRGLGIAEDIQVVRYMEEHLPDLAPYKKRLRRGLLYRKIKRTPIDESQRQVLYQQLSAELQATDADYRLERWNQYLRWLWPWLTTRQRDRL